MTAAAAARSQAGLSPAARGMLVMLLAMFLFSLNDAMGKWLVSTYTVGQVLLIRSAFALAILAPFVWRAGLSSLVCVERPWQQLARVVCSTVEVFCFYYSVSYLPLADVVTYWLAAPIYVAAMSPFLLGERVGPIRWTAIAIGFIGVVIALTPSGTVEPLAIGAAIVGTLAFALMVVTGRTLRGTPDKTLVTFQLLGSLAAGLVLSPFGWVTPTAPDFILLGALGVVAMFAHICVNRAVKLADAAIIAPFQYTMLPWGIILGWLFFDDLPRPVMLIGAAIITLSGLVIYIRERKQQRSNSVVADTISGDIP
ncbi:MULTISPECIES: DMT family transporter [unclassified Aminobacter]|uniref:DMT family transporter n=1 Tax=unclassified Aminobacter TaxID=2644704 RepID=UPI0004666302|nr:MULTISPECIES: DMT family transporter [unclassified Aminobacter]TWG64107.1 EamA domain-containing membrane protein RarD [Aminobacter sp. J44]TWH34710.1 EamA domain-containing membrane protein RarD [Aminobacter sp. J15]